MDSGKKGEPKRDRPLADDPLTCGADTPVRRSSLKDSRAGVPAPHSFPAHPNSSRSGVLILEGRAPARPVARWVSIPGPAVTEAGPPGLVGQIAYAILEGRAPARPVARWVSFPGPGRHGGRPSRFLSDRLVTLSWRGGLPHALSRDGSPSRDRPSGQPEALGLRRASPLSPGAERRPRNCIRKNADCPPDLRNSHPLVMVV